ncbi:hypothetical protein SUBVAR_05186 [Subdoligranulum variabile DSM 15176]|uniref:Uncharacterized protein n=1 Tax=Subdoligranulum variabile DSM 15176 TaxID=411471 RepID=D1PLE6_9FIRM|nr:hypothetical protein SUBVAR_05186 [Subdoligranulum variabile DSM 15176]
MGYYSNLWGRCQVQNQKKFFRQYSQRKSAKPTKRPEAIATILPKMLKL